MASDSRALWQAQTIDKSRIVIPMISKSASPAKTQASRPAFNPATVTC